MRIRHWQGYGTVDAKKVRRSVCDGTVTLVVRVSGDHEWGLIRDDGYDLGNWLVKRFDKGYRGQPLEYSYDPGILEDGTETCEYSFCYREG